MNKILKQVVDTYQEGELTTLEPLLPILLRIDKHPFTLDKHFFFKKIFETHRPKYFLLKCARQVGKSYSTNARDIVISMLEPNYKSLYVLPRHDQAKRISKEITKELILDSPYGEMFTEGISQAEFTRKFNNNSAIHFSYAFLDPDRIRSFSGIANLVIDEAQDFNWDFIPAIGAVTDAHETYGFHSYTGTPKGLANALEDNWGKSSMSEWVTRCDSCGHFNIPNLEHDLLQMIGKKTVICAKCGAALDCSVGQLVHKYPEKAGRFLGIHVPQIICPIHYQNPHKWLDLLDKVNGNVAEYTTSKLYNEVFGESYDSSQVLLSKTDLIKVARDQYHNKLNSAIQSLKNYEMVSCGIDWGGGGDESVSYTSITFAGMRKGSDIIDILFGCKLPRTMAPEEQAKEIMYLLKKIDPQIVGHDFGGAGDIREILLIQAGWPIEKIMPFTYVRDNPKNPVIKYNPPQEGYRLSYSFKRTQSIIVLCNMIKAGKVTLPNFETSANYTVRGFDATLALDFTHLRAEQSSSPRGADSLLIHSENGKSDDFVHSTNYACSSLWHIQQRYPDLAESNQLKITVDQMKEVAKKYV